MSDTDSIGGAADDHRGAVLRRYLVPAAIGCAIGLAAAVGQVSRATSYLGDSPETCINCHIMNPQYATWQHSAHANVAVCNDCHVPHDNFAHHYLFKSQDGMRHSAIFTMRAEPQVIRLSDRAVPVVESNCQRCHDNVIHNVALGEYQPGDPRCWDCHRSTPHGTVRSLSATPTVMRPQLGPIGLRDQPPAIGGRAPRAPKEIAP